MTTSLPCRAELVVDHHPPERLVGFLLGRGDNHTLTTSQAIRLDDHLVGHGVEVLARRFVVVEVSVLCRGDVVALHEVFGIGLGAFKAGSSLGWSKASNAN